MNPICAKWFVVNNVIKGVTSLDTNIYPNAKEIYLATDTIEIENNKYTFDIDCLKFSKLIPLDFLVKIYVEDNQIKVNVFAVYKDNKYKISEVNNINLGYCIIDNVWYYLNNEVEDVFDFLMSANYYDKKYLKFLEYVNLLKLLENNNYRYIDQTEEKLKNIEIENKIESSMTLFPYQKVGVSWMNFMADNNCGCILADSMGLGKTLQIIYFLSHIKEKNNKLHALIVSPLSLLENWRREFNKFCPKMNVHINYGCNKHNYYKDLLSYDVIIDSYNGVQSGFGMYQMVEWDVVVLDEAQNIKNPDAQRTRIVKQIPRKLSIAVTGTPFENHLTDLWSLTDFVIKEYFGTIKEFNSEYDDNVESAKRIEKFLSPIMIRRKVEDVAKDLPEKVDIPQPIIMTESEAMYYDNELHNIEELKKTTLDKIQKLRLFCSHPSVYNPSLETIDPATLSDKYKRCCEILEEIIQNDEKTLIFASFSRMIDILCNDLNNRFNIPVLFIDGRINSEDRQMVIDEFSDIQGAAILVLNPSACGAGLNITAANHVIHYNLEWNPSKEDQATARAYRRGQTKTVFVHRLYYVNTIEDVINSKITRKRELSDTVVVGNEGTLNASDLAKALSISPLKTYGETK